MSGNKLPVITINREYGAGGRSVAKGLSEKLGIPWYDQDIITETARDSGFSEADIQKNGEGLSYLDAFIDDFTKNASYTSIHDSIFEAQKKEILKLADKPCIIVGRLSNFILKEAEIEAFNVFLYADFALRMKHIGELKQNGKHDLKRFVERRDTLRLNYFRHYTGTDLDNIKNYNLCIDTGKIGTEKAVEVVVNALKSDL